MGAFGAIEFRNTSFVQIQDSLFFYCFIVSCYGDWDAGLGDSFAFVTICGKLFLALYYLGLILMVANTRLRLT